MFNAKFRVWDPVDERMNKNVRVTCQDQHVSVKIQKNCEWETINPKYLMQSTGLFDTTGNELFEGDIVKRQITDDNDEEDVVGVIVLVEGRFSLVSSNLMNEKYSYELYGEEFTITCLGNIFTAGQALFEEYKEEHLQAVVKDIITKPIINIFGIETSDIFIKPNEPLAIPNSNIHDSKLLKKYRDFMSDWLIYDWKKKYSHKQEV